ncbi:MAG: cysteinyl-tRNA synthetase [Alyxoria varia]|nr:MAG: cysteinyl-tRNA synthetase [Alyxoria varia]
MPIGGVRHPSSSSTGADSWRSDDTIKASSLENVRTSSKKPTPGDMKTFFEDTELSPGAKLPRSSSPNARLNIAPWDEPPASDNHSRPSEAQGPKWGGFQMARNESNDVAKRTPGMSSVTALPSFPPDAKEGQDVSQSRGDRVKKGGTNSPVVSRAGLDRKISEASSSEMSSNNSNRGRGGFRKLQGFFGDDTQGFSEPRQGSQTSLGPFQTDGAEEWPSRKHSFSNQLGRTVSGQPSPGQSRPRTPQQPSSEVTPWLYQDAEDISQFGDAPVREQTQGQFRAPMERQRTADSSKGFHSHRFNLHRHRTHKSSEEPPPSNDMERAETFPSLSRGLSHVQSNHSSKDLSSQHSISPPNSSTTYDGQESVSSKGDSKKPKRSIFDKLKHRHKDRQVTTAATKDAELYLTPTASTTNVGSSQVNLHEQPSSKDKAGPSSTPQASGRKDHHHPRLPFKKGGRRPSSHEVPQANRDPQSLKVGVDQHGTLWNLDTNLSDLEGIVNEKQQPMLNQTNQDVVHGKADENFKDKQNPSTIAGVWDAPDSWAVKRVGDENVEKLDELDQNGHPIVPDDPGLPFFLRIYRPDSSFATVSMPLGTTTAELVQMMGKKTPLSDDLNRYSIILRKHETSRQLNAGERPFAIQKRLLEQVGYTESDHIEELGRDDHGYLCRFIFLSTKSIGYSSLEKDPAFNKMQKFSNMDLQGRNLTTIPIALYQKSSEIVFLNLSRNLSLDVPKDFVQGCSSLREIRYTANEAIRLPQSFNLAYKLTVLDISNNRLDRLDYAELDKLEKLASLKLANNKLTAVPKGFANFKSLRSLNLSSNFLDELPDCICNLKTLVDLDISFNAISELPRIGGLENLERLFATNNKLSGRPEDSVANLKRLREVDIRFNYIDNIDVLTSLPQVELLLAGHNSITAFEGSFQKIRTLHLDHNPVTRFSLNAPAPTLNTLNLASAKLVQLPDDTFAKLSGLTKLILTKNHFASLSPHIGKMAKLDFLSVARNSLNGLPSEIGRLSELRFLDARENNITYLPSEMWLCRRLETINISSNCLESFPKVPSQASMAEAEGLALTNSSSTSTLAPASTNSSEDADKLGEIAPSTNRRLSQTSGGYSNGNSPSTSNRKGSLASLYGQAPRKPSALTRTPTEQTMSPLTRKDSLPVNRISSTFAGSLRNLYLADNRLSDDVFDQIAKLPELRIVNLSYNELYDIPSRIIRKWQNLTELYLSGNDLTSLPAEDFEDLNSLKVLHINGNKFQVLPAELGKVQKLTILDASSNNLKYNVSNWPYDWNWNWNRNLRYLNLSGNKRLEIKPAASHPSSKDAQDLTDFGTLSSLRVLGLMDVTLMIPSVPDQTEDRRVRTSGSNVGSMAYGISDCLGYNEHLSTIDIVVPRLEGHDGETLIGLFDGLPLANGGSKIVKYLQENFERQFREELKRKSTDESPAEALRRTYLALNKDLGTWANQSKDTRRDAAHFTHRGALFTHRGSVASQNLTQEDMISGCVATVLYLHQMELYVSNIGNCEALLIQSEGGHRTITRKHDPADAVERARIRDAGGYVSRQGKLNDVLEVSRAFGFTQLVPAVVAAPHTSRIQIQETDEMILLASRELWEYLTPDFAVDLARSERGDLMRASQKLRDLAIAFGATSKITVMLIGVSDLRRRERPRYRTHSMSMGPSGLPDEYRDMQAARPGKRPRERTGGSKLTHLDQEVEAPVGDVTLVFTDIKNSTLLWETYPIAMRSAIRMHNEMMRRHLRLIGGYEVKTEGDAFIVAFPTVTSALLWAFTIQSQLLELEWPQEILQSVSGQEVSDPDGNVLFRGLSVRMGIHWGQPVCETDPVTRRMDYFGPMVNRAARISGVADGGQITVSSDFIAEVQRLLETHIESDRSNSTGSDDQRGEDAMSFAIRRELRSLSSHGFEVKDLGEKRLKGLENPEYIYLMYPHSLSGRLVIQQQRDEAERAAAQGAGMKSKNSQLTIDLDNVWDLWGISLRLEMLCSAMESPGSSELKPPETALLERTKERGGEVTDRFLVNFVEHQISRIETCVTSLSLRNLVRPFHQGMLTQACPMTDILGGLSNQLAELKTLKEQIDIDMAPS